MTIHFPDPLANELRRRARQEGRSLSSFVVELVRAQLQPREWPEDFKALFGSWEGDLPIPDDPVPDEHAWGPEPKPPPRR